MSLKKFLRKLWDGIKKLFQGLDKELQEWLPYVINVVNNIKNYTGTNIPDLITILIPGDKDDKIVAKLRELLPKILLELESDQAILALPTLEEKVAAIIAKIKGSHPNAQKVFWTGLASLLSESLADGKLTFAELLAINQFVYVHKLNLPAEEQDQHVDEDDDDETTHVE